MVVPNRADDGDRTYGDRAQLILVGSVTLALIIVGLTVVLNTILFTDTVTTAVTTQGSDDAVEFDANARRDVSSIVLRLNHRHQNESEAHLETAIRRNLTNYSRLVAESYAVDRPVFVNVSYENASFGQRFVQSSDDNFTSPGYASPGGDEPDWTPVDPDESSAGTDVGWMVANLDVVNTSEDPVTITVENDSRYARIMIERDDGSGVPKVSIDTERNFAGSTNTTGEECTSVGGRVLVDVLRGSSFTGDCQFNATQGLEPPFTTVTIEDGDRASGKLSIVVNESRSELDAFTVGGTDYDYEECDPVVDRTDPCQAPAVWRTNVTVSYGARTIDYQRTHNVSVYP